MSIELVPRPPGVSRTELTYPRPNDRRRVWRSPAVVYLAESKVISVFRAHPVVLDPDFDPELDPDVFMEEWETVESDLMPVAVVSAAVGTRAAGLLSTVGDDPNVAELLWLVATGGVNVRAMVR